VRSRLSNPAIKCTSVIGREIAGSTHALVAGSTAAVVSNASIVESAPRNKESSVDVASVIENVPLSPWKIAHEIRGRCRRGRLAAEAPPGKQLVEA
jgi:hypothetical protein